MTEAAGASDALLFGLSAQSLIAVALAALLCGFVGTFVVLRRLVALGGGIAHASFGGIGVAVVAGVDPRLGAAAVALGAAALLARLPRERSDRQDATIGVLWAVGMAAGMLLLAGPAARGSGDADVESYLFGDVARVRPEDLWALGAIVAAVIVAHLLRGRELVATAFDPEQARLQGLPVGALSLLLLALVALSIVALLQLVGVVLAIALLAIPPLVALRLCRSMRAVVACGAAVALAIQIAGLRLAGGIGWPAGPTIVLVGAVALGLARLAPRPGRRAALIAAIVGAVWSGSGARGDDPQNAGAVATPVSAGALAAPTSIELIGSATLPQLEFAGVDVGGLSGLAYDADEGAFFALSDDRGEYGPPRLYRLAIDLADGKLDDGDVAVVGRTNLRTATGERFEPGILDPEGLALDPAGGYFVATEGVVSRGVAPFVASFGADGRERRRFALPKRFLADPGGGASGVRDNLGFESLTVTPDGAWLVAGLESSLLGDGPAADIGVGSLARLLFLPLSESGGVGWAREFAYPLAPLSLPPPAEEAYRVNGLSELAALSPTSFLALEREFASGVGLRVRLLLVSLDGATEVQAIERLHEAAIVPARKTLLLDFAQLGLALDNFEALALGPRLRDGRRVLVVVSDDNFDSVLQRTIFLAFAVDDRPLGIAQIQGRSHRSPFEGRWVAGIEGTVTAIDDGRGRNRQSGFAIESAAPDGDAATSEAIWIAAEPDAALAPGDRVRVAGHVEERTAGAKQLPVTTLAASAVERLPTESNAAPLPPPLRLGRDLKVPAQVDGDALADFRPERDAIDFWESLESMRVEIPPAVVTGPTLSYREAVLIADEGSAEERTDAGGRLLFPGGPELDRWIVGGRFLPGFPDLAVGARVAGAPVGIVDYSFSNYKIQLLTPPEVVTAGEPCRATTTLRSEGERITIATLNVENLSAVNPPERFERFGRAIVEQLGSPAILAVEEIQDDSGTARGDGVVTAEATLGRLVAAVAAHGGPRYRTVSIDPEPEREGGQPGGNIRIAVLFDPDRIGFEPRGSAGPLTAATVVGMEEGLRFEPNPGRVAPTSEAFALESGEGVRRSLAVELRVGERPLFVIANHWSSKWDDDRAFGAVQPPIRPTGEKRLAQALVIRKFVERILAASPQAWIVVLGDFNDLPWSEPVERLSAPPMQNLLLHVPSSSRYTYNFEGSAQAIDTIVVSRPLANGAEIEAVHLNSNCPDSLRISDHDPVIASLRVGARAGRRSR